MNNDNTRSFYEAFTESYLLQLSRFRHLNEGKIMWKKYDEGVKACSNNLKNILDVSLGPIDLSALMTQRKAVFADDIQNAIERYLIEDKHKGYLIFSGAKKNPINLSDENYFNNLTNFLAVAIKIICKKYQRSNKLYKPANSQENVVISIEYDEDTCLYSPGRFQSDNEINNFFNTKDKEDAKTKKNKILTDTYFCKCESNPNPPENDLVKPDNSLIITELLHKCEEILCGNSQYIPEDVCKKILEKIMFDSRFNNIRDRLQNMYTCDHDWSKYIVFTGCNRQHCGECLKNRITIENLERVAQSICPCKLPIAHATLKELGYNINTTCIPGRK